ncbi:MAG: hypothetical protein GKS03_17050 [Alphaproteobacteria bacterium]|nr:hypothetical protein [Alphaproteobacteria bacterium]
MTPVPLNLTTLPRDRLEDMVIAGEQVLECMRVLGNTGDSIVGEVVNDFEDFAVWSHYPKGDVIDRQTHSQFYYHAHPEQQRPGEHGHFHLFLRCDGIPETVQPADIGVDNALDDFKTPMCHILAIAMNQHGMPIALFTTNRWVTMDPWFDAADTISLLDQFDIDIAKPSWPLNVWMSAMVRLYRPDIEILLHERDSTMTAADEQSADGSAYNDRSIEIASLRDIDLADRIDSVNAAWATIESTA